MLKNVYVTNLLRDICHAGDVSKNLAKQVKTEVTYVICTNIGSV